MGRMPGDLRFSFFAFPYRTIGRADLCEGNFGVRILIQKYKGERIMLDVKRADIYGIEGRSGYKEKTYAQGAANQGGFRAAIEDVEKRKTRSEMTEEEMQEELDRLDEELARIKEENRRERERLQELRIEKRRLKKKILEKLALKKYLARQDEIRQLNERISLERMVGEDVYIEKAPLSKSLSMAEIKALCSGD